MGEPPRLSLSIEVRCGHQLQGFSTSAPLTFVANGTAVWGCPVHFGVFTDPLDTIAPPGHSSQGLQTLPGVAWRNPPPLHYRTLCRWTASLWLLSPSISNSLFCRPREARGRLLLPDLAQSRLIPLLCPADSGLPPPLSDLQWLHFMGAVRAELPARCWARRKCWVVSSCCRRWGRHHGGCTTRISSDFAQLPAAPPGPSRPRHAWWTNLSILLPPQ